jgi:hypothetical protein
MSTSITRIWKRYACYPVIYYALIAAVTIPLQGQPSPDHINFVRQGARRLVFDEDQSISLASMNPGQIIGLPSMHPVSHHLDKQARIKLEGDMMIVRSDEETQTGIWFGGFNPFATYSIDLGQTEGDGEIGFAFSDAGKKEQFFITVGFDRDLVTGVRLKITGDAAEKVDESVAVNLEGVER